MPVVDLKSSPEKTNGTKLSRLLIDGGTAVLQNVFSDIHKPLPLQQFLKNKESILWGLRYGNKKFTINTEQWKRLFPPNGAPPNVCSFDITLLVVLLRNICGLEQPKMGWDKMPREDETSLQANLVRIKCLRNKIYAHATKTGIDNDLFNQYWTELSRTLVSLGLDQSKIDDLEDAPLENTSDLEKLSKWKREEDKVQQENEVKKHGLLQIATSPERQANHGPASATPVRLRSEREREKFGQSALHIAVAEGQTAEVKRLLEGGADVNTTDKFLRTSLHIASRSGHKDIVSILIEYEADVAAKDKFGQSASSKARQHGHIQIFDALSQRFENCFQPEKLAKLAYSKSGCRNKEDGYMPIHLACIRGEFHLLCKLILNGIIRRRMLNQPATPRDSRTALNFLENESQRLTEINQKRSEGQDFYVDMILNVVKTAKEKPEDGLSEPPLLNAVTRDDPEEVVALVLDGGEHLDLMDNKSETLLHLAARGRSSEMVETLLDLGANIEAKASDGCTPLKRAFLANNYSAFHSLVTRGADFTAEDSDGRTLLHVTAEKGLIDRLRVLVNQLQAASQFEAPHQAADRGHAGVVHGVDLDCADRLGMTPLHHAVQNKRRKVVKLLLQNGADPNVQMKENLTERIFFYQKKKSCKCILIYKSAIGLVKQKVQVGSDNMFGNVLTEESGQIERIKEAEYVHEVKDETPLHLACKINSKSIVKLLLKSKADMTKKDAHGFTPLHTASIYGSLNAAEALLKRGADVMATSDAGSTPLYLAELNKLNEHKALACSLREKGATAQGSIEKIRTPSEVRALEYAKSVLFQS